jgi:methylthioribose-1-phosphate isomerase
MVLRAIKYSRGELQILDQTKLPHQERYDPLRSSSDGWHAIKDMRVRGAPAIAIVAALALAVELETIQASGKLSEIAEEVKVFVYEKLDYLITSRPTAVNLADAAQKLKRTVAIAADGEEATGEKVKNSYIQAAEKMLVDDVRDNENIGRHGAEWIAKNCVGIGKKAQILTHCNTGYANHFSLPRPAQIQLKIFVTVRWQQPDMALRSESFALSMLMASLGGLFAPKPVLTIKAHDLLRTSFYTTRSQQH